MIYKRRVIVRKIGAIARSRERIYRDGVGPEMPRILDLMFVGGVPFIRGIVATGRIPRRKIPIACRIRPPENRAISNQTKPTRRGRIR